MRHAGVVHPYVQAPELLHGGLREPLRILRAANVGYTAPHATARHPVSEPGYSALDVLCRRRAHDHLVAELEELLCHGQAKAPRAARHDDRKLPAGTIRTWPRSHREGAREGRCAPDANGKCSHQAARIIAGTHVCC